MVEIANVERTKQSIEEKKEVKRWSRDMVDFGIGPVRADKIPIHLSHMSASFALARTSVVGGATCFGMLLI